MKIKVAEASGPVLDWMVAKCEYDDLAAKNIQYPQHAKHYPVISPSTDWALAGPIIEREGIAIDCVRCDGKIDGWIAALPLFCEAKYEEASPTPLTAAMRCYVLAKLGKEVEVPEGLV